jgi:hypothetical protein
VSEACRPVDIFSFQKLQIGNVIYVRRRGKETPAEAFVVVSNPYDFRNRPRLLRMVEVLDPETGNQIPIEFSKVERKAG